MYWATRRENEHDKSPEYRSAVSYKSSKSKLPMGIQKHEVGQMKYRVRINRISIGQYRTLDEAIEVRDAYLNK